MHSEIDTCGCGIRSKAEDNHAYSEGLRRSPEEYDEKHIPLCKKNIDNIIVPKERNTRIITDTLPWVRWITDTGIVLSDPSIQWNYLNETIQMDDSQPWISLVKTQITQKIRGYRSQDLLKHLFSEKDFINYDYVLGLLFKCHLQCFYCREPTMILYDSVREPRQWTLERINNKFGHNCGNVQIACLTCNLRRGTMFHERYLLTKKIMNVVKLSEPNS